MKKVPISYPTWQGASHNIGEAFEAFIPFFGLIGLFNDRTSYQITDAIGDSWSVITKHPSTKNTKFVKGTVGKIITRLFIAYSTYSWAKNYSDPNFVIKEYHKTKMKYGPCLTEKCVHDRIEKIIKKMKRKEKAKKTKKDNKKDESEEEESESAEIQSSDEKWHNEEVIGVHR